MGWGLYGGYDTIGEYNAAQYYKMLGQGWKSNSSPTVSNPSFYKPSPAPARSGGGGAATAATPASSSTDYLNKLFQQIQGETGPTKTTTVAQARSTPLDSAIAALQGKIGGLETGIADAYTGKYNAYEGLAKALADMYNTQTSGAQRSQVLSSLSSGLTPGEAAGAGTQVMQRFLQQYFPQLSSLRAEQATVPIEKMNALSSLAQALNLPLLRDVISPYEQGVAGRTETITDTLGRQGLLMDIAKALQTGELTRAELSNALALQRMRGSNALDLQGLSNLGAMDRALLGEQSAMDRLMAEIGGRYDLQELLGEQNLSQIDRRYDNEWDLWSGQQDYLYGKEGPLPKYDDVGGQAGYDQDFENAWQRWLSPDPILDY